jgi:hypothetical protein
MFSIQQGIESKRVQLVQDLTTLANVWAAKFVCCLMNFTLKFEWKFNILIVEIMEQNLDTPLCFACMASNSAIASPSIVVSF